MFTVAIIGRPNVGKSTLANTFAEKKGAVTSPVFGTTRDYVSQRVSWRGQEFTVIDTGGVVFDPKEPLEKEVQKKIDSIIKKADLLLFLGDARTGITNIDRKIAHYLKKFDKKTLFVVNKVDSDKHLSETYAFKSLGADTIIPISAITGKGIGDLLDEISGVMSNVAEEKEVPEEKPFRFALLGKVNAGKSTLFNTIIKENRVIESDIPGTTVDLIDHTFTYGNTPLSIVDTAGIRKKANVTEAIEKQSRKKTLHILRKIDLACLVIDISKPISRQDQRIARDIETAYIPTIIIANKSDLACTLTDTKECSEFFKEKTREIRHKLSILYFADIIFVSSKEKYNVRTILGTVRAIEYDRKRIVSYERLKGFLFDYLITHPPRSRRGKVVSTVKDISLISSDPLLIGLHTSKKGFVADKFIRHLAKSLHEYLKIKSRPLHIKIIK